MDLFKKNIAALGSYNIVLAQKLLNLEGQELQYDLHIGNDPANINLFEKEGFTPLYKGVPLDETLMKVKEFDKYKRYPYLYFFGIGNGVFYKVLLENKTHKRITIFEPNLEILFIIFHVIDFSEDLKTERLSILHTEQLTLDILHTLFGHDAKAYSRVYDLHIVNKYYEDKYEPLIHQINQMCLKTIHHHVVSMGNDINDNLLGLRHFLRNVPHVVTRPTLKELLKKAKNTETAVLAATGPSLQKQLPLLQRIQDHVTILCIDASFPILTRYGIKPDIVFSMERIEPTGTFYERVAKEYGFEAFEDVVFALTSIVHKKTLQWTTLDKRVPKSAVTQLSNRPLKYLKMFGLDEWGYMGRGMSAANMAFELAFLSNFKRVILIGQDLAYGKDGTSHARGNIWGEDQLAHRVHDLYVDAYGGEGKVRTSKTWQMFLNFYEKDVEEFCAAKPSFEPINATQGGARIAGTIEMPFEEAVIKYVDFDRTKQRVATTIEYPEAQLVQSSKEKMKENLQSFIDAGEEVKEKAEETFLKLAKECESLEKLNEEDRLDEVDLDYLVELIEEIDEVKAATQKDPFNRVFMDLVTSFIAHQELELAKVQVSNTETAEEKKGKMVEWIYAHRYWLFSLAGGIEAILDTMKENEEAIMAM